LPAVRDGNPFTEVIMAVTYRCGQCDADVTAVVTRACSETESHTTYIKILGGPLRQDRIALKKQVWVECPDGHITGFLCPDETST
jgi:hypothetical protein